MLVIFFQEEMKQKVFGCVNLKIFLPQIQIRKALILKFLKTKNSEILSSTKSLKMLITCNMINKDLKNYNLYLYLLRIADTSLIMSQRLSEYCGVAPILEEDLSISNISLDYLGKQGFCIRLFLKKYLMNVLKMILHFSEMMTNFIILLFLNYQILILLEQLSRFFSFRPYKLSFGII